VSRQADYEKRRRNRGMCGHGGCQEKTGDDSYYCEAHGSHRLRTKKLRKLADAVEGEE